MNLYCTSGLRFVDEDEPESIIYTVNAAYLGLCQSHSLESINIPSLAKVFALILRAEGDFCGSVNLKVHSDALRNGAFVVCFLGVAGRVNFWNKPDWAILLAKISAMEPTEFLRGLQEEIGITSEVANRFVSRSAALRD
jgi:hypothetical protein